MSCNHEYKDIGEYDTDRRWCIHCYEDEEVLKLKEQLAAAVKIYCHQTGATEEEFMEEISNEHV